MNILRQFMLYSMVVFYLFAGYNHFINPTFYLPLIPPYLGQWSVELNLLAGIVELLLGILLIPKITRKWAAWGIVLMLIAFIPSHIYFIQKGYFSLGSFTMTPIISWVRLILVQPLLILWALWISRE